MAITPRQFGLRTLLLAVTGVAVYIAVFKLSWHWTLLASGTALPVFSSLMLARRWARLTIPRQTVLRAIAYSALALAFWLVWAVFVILGPGEAIFELFHELIPGVREWNRVWKR